MKKTTKVLALLLCAVALVVGSVMGTLAYLTYTTEIVQNTFTVGKVEIDLDEAKVNEDGEKISEERVKANEYHLLPGHTYIKDPTVTVKAGSDDCYVRMKVQVANLDELMKAIPKEKYPAYYNGDVFLLQMLVTGWDNNVWAFEKFDATANTYEFRYVGGAEKNGIVPAPGANNEVELEALFQEIVVPEFLDNDSIAHLANVKINVTAEAIQADGFDTAADAWAKF